MQYYHRRHLFTVNMWIIPLVGYPGSCRRSYIHTATPERVLLGSLLESDSHILRLMPVIGWSVSEQDGAYEQRKVALGFAYEKKIKKIKRGVTLFGILLLNRKTTSSYCSKLCVN